jgi:hypothetical protein
MVKQMVTDKIAGWYDSRKEMMQERILYGLRYSGLSIQWGSAALLEKFLGVLQRKMNMLLIKMHSSSIATANRIWDKRKRLGQGDQEVTSDQPAEVKQIDPDKVEELVEADEALVVGETLYEVEMDRPSEHTNVC